MGMPYFKAYSEGILRGSLADTEPLTQLIWIKMLAVANETRDRDGYLWFKKGRPYTRSFISSTINVTEEQLEKAISEYLNDIRDGLPRVQILEDGTIYLTNFSKYQAKPVKEEPVKPPLSEAQKNAIAIKQGVKNPEIATTIATLNGNAVWNREKGVLEEDAEVLRKKSEMQEAKDSVDRLREKGGTK